jgi:hypothetical protein
MCRYLTVLLFIGLARGQEMPKYQKNLLFSLNSTKTEIDNIQLLIKQSYNHGIKDNNPPMPKFRLKLSDYSQILSDLDNLKSFKDYYLDSSSPFVHNIDLALIEEYKSELLNKSFLSQYNSLYEKYTSVIIDRSFYEKEFFTPDIAYQNDKGLWVTNNGGIFYVAKSNWTQWASMGITLNVLEPTQKKYINATICADAKIKYSKEWNRFLVSRDKKYTQEVYLHKLIKRELIPKIDVLYNTKKDSAIIAFPYVIQLKTDQESQFNKIVAKARDSGVFIPENKIHDYDYIYNKIKTFGMTLERRYQSHLRFKKEGNIKDAAYYLFNLIATDKKKTHENGHNDFFNFKDQFEDKIIDAIQLEFINEGRFENFCSRPLTNFDCLLLASLVDEKLMSKFSHDESNRHQLPKVNLTNKDIKNILGAVGYDIFSIVDFKAITNFDNNALENLYRYQLDQIKIKDMITDNFGVLGLLSGQNLILYDEQGNINIYKVILKHTESWGMKQYSLQFEKNEKKIKSFINIRLKAN